MIPLSSVKWFFAQAKGKKGGTAAKRISSSLVILRNCRGRAFCIIRKVCSVESVGQRLFVWKIGRKEGKNMAFVLAGFVRQLDISWSYHRERSFR